MSMTVTKKRRNSKCTHSPIATLKMAGCGSIVMVVMATFVATQGQMEKLTAMENFQELPSTALDFVRELRNVDPRNYHRNLHIQQKLAYLLDEAVKRDATTEYGRSDFIMAVKKIELCKRILLWSHLNPSILLKHEPRVYPNEHIEVPNTSKLENLMKVLPKRSGVSRKVGKVLAKLAVDFAVFRHQVDSERFMFEIVCLLGKMGMATARIA